MKFIRGKKVVINRDTLHMEEGILQILLVDHLLVVEEITLNLLIWDSQEKLMNCQEEQVSYQITQEKMVLNRFWIKMAHVFRLNKEKNLKQINQ